MAKTSKPDTLSEHEWKRVGAWMKRKGISVCTSCNNHDGSWRRTDAAVSIKGIEKQSEYVAIMMACSQCALVRLLDASLIFPEWWEEGEDG